MSTTPDWRADRIGAALRGENPMVMARMRSGFAVIGDSQLLPGWSVLLSDDPEIRHLTDLDLAARAEFLLDMTLLGEAILAACRGSRVTRMNYEILGNTLPVLHAHVIPRYAWEPEHNRVRQALTYGEEAYFDPRHAYSDEAHGELRATITAALEPLMERAYRAGSAF